MLNFLGFKLNVDRSEVTQIVSYNDLIVIQLRKFPMKD